jgi:hypothetical protein
VTRSQSNEIVKKDLSDVGAGLAVAVGSSLLIKMLSRRGRIVRTLALASVAATTTIVRSRLFANHKTTKYSLTRQVDRAPSTEVRDV